MKLATIDNKSHKENNPCQIAIKDIKKIQRKKKIGGKNFWGKIFNLLKSNRKKVITFQNKC